MNGQPRSYNERMKARPPEFATVFCLGMAGIMVASCSRDKEPAPAAIGKPNVLLVTLDTTRADFLSCYGGPAGTTPAMDRVAKEGIRYTSCYTTAPITLPAHATIMTGLLPFQHQLRDNGAGVLDGKAVTMAELFCDAGYRTGAFVGAYVLHSRYGLNQGFEVYGDEFRGATTAHMHDGAEFAERNAKDVSDAAIGWLDQKDDRPFFAWIHYFDPHAPYAAPGRPQGGEVRAEYAAEVKFVDSQLSRVLERVESLSKSAGREEWVVIVADHGEGLGEHNEDTHGFFTYNTTVHVPLIVRGPRIASNQISQTPVSLIDLYPSIAAWLGFSVPHPVPGHILPAAGGSVPERPLYFETRIPFHAYGWSPLEGVIVGGDKLISAPTPELYELASDPAERENRFAARRERAAELGELLASAKKSGPGVPVLSVGKQETDNASLQKLRSLGYVSTPREMPGGEVKLLDPKEVIWIRPKLLEAERMLAAGDAKAAAQMAEVFTADPHNIKALNLLVENLRNPQARGLLISVAKSRVQDLLYPPYDMELPAYLGIALCKEGKPDEGLEAIGRAEAVDNRSPIPKAARGECLEQTGRAEEVVAMWEAVLRDNPQDFAALKSLGDIYVKLKQPERAVEFYTRAISANESDAETRAKLGSVLKSLGRPAEAMQELRRALQLSPQLVVLHSELGSILLEQGKAAEAVEEYSRFVAARPELPNAHYDLGVALSHNNMPAKAVEQFRETLRLSPDHGDAWVNLGVALLRQGQAKEGTDALTRATQIASVAGAAHLNLAIAASQAGDQQGMIRHLESGASSNPPSLPALEELSAVYVRQRRFVEAVRVLRAGLLAAPDNPKLLHYLASILATCPDDSIRDGKEALRLAEQAAGLQRPAHPVLLSTLASAQAETGDFASAIRTVNEALALQYPAALGEILRRQLELFQSGQPSRELRLLQVY